METIQHIDTLSKSIQVSGILSLLVVVIALIGAYFFLRKFIQELKKNDTNYADAIIEALKKVQEEKSVFQSEKITNLSQQVEIYKAEIDSLKDDIKALNQHLRNRENQITEALNQKEYFRGKLNNMEHVFEKLNIKVA